MRISRCTFSIRVQTQKHMSISAHTATKRMRILPIFAYGLRTPSPFLSPATETTGREGFELSRINEQGLWEGHFEGFKEFDAYKYLIIAQDGRKLMKCDPYAFHAETRPGTASKIYELGSFEWTDGAWMKKRRRKNIYASPMNIYELHVGSWQRYADGNTLSYRELADRLPMLSTWATRTSSCCR